MEEGSADAKVLLSRSKTDGNFYATSHKVGPGLPAGCFLGNCASGAFLSWLLLDMFLLGVCVWVWV